MTSRANRIERWLATKDQVLVALWALTLVGFILRWLLAVGFLLGDDMAYMELARDAMNGNFMTIEPTGQYSYRPMWIYPMALGFKLFGWGRHSLVLYPMVCGSLLPLLTASWMRRHLPADSKAPLLCAVILQCYPIMFVDSLILVNEIPMIFWALVCLNFFGAAYSQLAQSAGVSLRAWRLVGLSLLAGLAFAASYQVKASAIPMLGLWLLGDLILQIRRHGWPHLRPLALAAGAFVIPTLAVQFFYYSKLGSLIGNFNGEARLYQLWLPRDYYQGTFDNAGTLKEYLLQLFFLDGCEGYRCLLHGIWAWMSLALILVAGLTWKSMPTEHRRLGVTFLSITIALFLFMNFWPAQIHPYYIPNCFSGRPWRYIDVLVPTMAVWISIILMQPGRFDRGFFRVLQIGLLSAGFGVAGYCLVIRFHEFWDRDAEFRELANTQVVIAPYLEVPHYIDVDGYGQLEAFLEMPKQPTINNRSGGLEKVTLDLRSVEKACLWTGGARHYGVGPDAAWSPENVKAIGGGLHLVHTWFGRQRPWRSYPLQLWLYERQPQTTNEPVKQP